MSGACWSLSTGEVLPKRRSRPGLPAAGHGDDPLGWCMSRSDREVSEALLLRLETQKPASLLSFSGAALDSAGAALTSPVCPVPSGAVLAAPVLQEAPDTELDTAQGAQRGTACTAHSPFREGRHPARRVRGQTRVLALKAPAAYVETTFQPAWNNP